MDPTSLDEEKLAQLSEIEQTLARDAAQKELKRSAANAIGFDEMKALFDATSK